MKPKLDTTVTVTLVLCALVTTALIIRRELISPPTPVMRAEQKTVLIDNWRALRNSGVRMGRSDAPVQLIEFADFECPFCASFHVSLKTLRDRYPTQVALSFVHFPLSGHRFAMPAARVAECAGKQGRFEAMHDRLFERQREFGLKPWSEMASEAGVPDLAAFESCVQQKDLPQKVIEGRRVGEQLNIQGTPTLIINGWKLGRLPSADELDDMVKAVLTGKNPVSK